MEEIVELALEGFFKAVFVFFMEVFGRMVVWIGMDMLFSAIGRGIGAAWDFVTARPPRAEVAPPPEGSS